MNAPALASRRVGAWRGSGRAVSESNIRCFPAPLHFLHLHWPFLQVQLPGPSQEHVSASTSPGFEMADFFSGSDFDFVDFSGFALASDFGAACFSPASAFASPGTWSSASAAFAWCRSQADAAAGARSRTAAAPPASHDAIERMPAIEDLSRA